MPTRPPPETTRWPRPANAAPTSRASSSHRRSMRLDEAQKTQTLAITGPYAYVRHPQYVGFILIMLGFLFQWPTFITLIMFPILVTMYVKLARREEREVLAEFGEKYRRYMNSTPAFFPRPRATRWRLEA